MNKTDIATAYIAGYLYQGRLEKDASEKIAIDEKGGYGDLVTRLGGEFVNQSFNPFSGLSVPERTTGAPTSLTSQALRASEITSFIPGLNVISAPLKIVNRARKYASHVADWLDAEKADAAEKTPVKRAAKWLGDHPYALAGGAGLTAAAGIYAIHRKIKADREAKEKADLEGLV